MADRNAETLSEEAAAWFVRRQRPQVSPADQKTFDAWMETPAHAVAYHRVEAAWERTERLRAIPAVAAAKPARRHVPGVMTRRAAAAVLLAGAGVATSLALQRRTPYATALGERRTVKLADGSHVNLNTASRIEVDFRGGSRRIRLLAGEALFDVAKDPKRPFVVQAGDARVQALGTVFNVRLRDASVEVTVAEGAVAVEATEKDAARMGTPSASRLAAGSAAMIGSGAVAELSLDASTLQRRVVWTEGVIDLHGETLEQAVAEFNRYSDIKLVVGDPTLAAVRVGGTFETDGADRFVQALEAGFGVRTVRGEGVTYLMPK